MKFPNYRRLLIKLGICLLGEIGLVSYLAIWRESFWNAVSLKDSHSFVIQLTYFTIVVLLLVLITGLTSYLINYISLLSRYKLTRKALKIKENLGNIEGYRQRIQEDCRDYFQLSWTLGSQLFSNAVKFIIFSIIIIKQSSIFNLIFCLIYVIIGTYIANKVAKPLISLNYNNQLTEAVFRQDLRKTLLSKLYINNMSIFIRMKYLQYFQSFYNQITVIIPLLFLSYPYFTGKISFGVLMQLSACIGSVIDYSSYFINSFDIINRWLSCKKRLKEINLI